MKKFCVRIGYVDYALDNERDAITLLGIFGRMRALDTSVWNESRRFAEIQDIPVDNISLTEVLERQAEPETDKCSDATQDTIVNSGAGEIAEPLPF